MTLTLLNLQLAGLTGPTVAHLGAGVLSTGKQGTANLVALQNCSLPAAHGLTAKKHFHQYCDVKAPQIVLVTSEHTGKTWRKKGEYLVLPQMQNFVTKAGH